MQLLVVDDQPLGDVIAREWNAQMPQPLQVQHVTTDALPRHGSLQADVVIYPASLIGSLVEQHQIVPLPASVQPHPRDGTGADDYQWSDIFAIERRHTIRWGQTAYAVTYGSPQFVLIYRPDLLQAQQLDVPQTWQQYEHVARQLAASDWAEAASDRFPVAEPVAAGWAAELLLARAAAYARHRSQYSTLFDFRTMQPLINGPPYVRALRELLALRPFLSSHRRMQSPTEVVASLLNGQCALAISWPSGARQLLPDSAPVPVAFAPLPGAEQVYNASQNAWEERQDDEPRHIPTVGIAGRCGSLTPRGRARPDALQLLLWTSGPQQGAAIASQSLNTAPFRRSQLDQPQIWVEAPLQAAADQYASVVAEGQEAATWFHTPRLPGREQYLQALDRAVRQALQDEQADPQAVLDQVATQWQALTEQFGRDRQQQAYQRSLGLQP